MKKNQGFTLVELIIVIVILGILAAYVTSRFSNLDSSARKTMMTTLYSSVKSASSAVHGAAVTNNDITSANSSIRVDGQDAAIVYGYAKASEDGIVKVIDTSSIGDDKDISMKVENNIVTFQHRTAKKGESCQVQYQYAGAAIGEVPEITIDVTDCE